jgi:hypothetical protein
VARFLRRPPPELAIVPLEREAILAAAGGHAKKRGVAPDRSVLH